jgi:hypothetical protein
MICYRQIKIDRPYVFTIQDESDKFLFVEPNKLAMYFCYDLKGQTTKLSYDINVKFFDFESDDKLES